ncbi:hypothetical protein Droror1_Dr00027489 [Drosera rotundifolia]
MLSAKSSSNITSVRLSNYFEGIVATSGSDGYVFPSRHDNLRTSSNFGGAFVHFANNTGSGAWDNSYVSSANTPGSGSYIEVYEKLHDLSAITNLEKLKALSIIDLLDEISSSKAASMYNSLDEPGKRFWSSVRLHQLDISRRYGRMSSIEELDISSSLIAWAFHSDCQETLFSSILSAEPSWLEMRKIGIGFWYSDAAQLRGKMEKLARLQYLKNKDPKACALLYIALNRIQVLAGLFKLSRDEKDKPLVAFLSRNFQEEKHKAAALKNAYVLMGRHQLELAIAFFLLGGDTMSAISVCAKNLGDEQLALVICHLVEGKGGPLEQHLISKIILPSATEKDDYWLASILQWMLGNYQRSFECMFGFGENSWLDGAIYPLKHTTLHDPSIGQYCQILAAKTSLRNAVGEQNSALLSRWAIVMTAAALKKSGHPLEALECLSSSSSIVGHVDQKGISGNSEGLLEIHRLLSTDDSNWISTDVASLLEDHVKSDLAMHHISELLLEHPSWIRSNAYRNASSYFQEHELPNYETLAKNFQAKLNSTITYVEQRFSLIPNLLLNKIMVSSSSHGLSLLGYQIVRGFDSSHNHSPVIRQPSNDLVSFDTTDISVTAKGVVHLVSRFVCYCSLIIPLTTPSSSPVKAHRLCHISEFYIRGILLALFRLKASFMATYGDSTKGAVAMLLVILDLCIYLVFIISSELQRNVKALTLLVKPLFDPSPDGRYGQIDSAKLREILIKVVELGSDDILEDRRCIFSPVASTNDEHGGSHVSMIPNEERWRFIEMCLWQHKSRFLAEQVNRLLDTEGNFHHSVSPVDELSPSMSALHEPKTSLENLYQVCVMLAESVGNMGLHMSSNHSRQLGAFLWQKLEDGSAEPYLQWLKKSSKLQARGLPELLHRSSVNSPTANGETLLQCPELSWDICLDHQVVKNGLAQVGIEVSELIRLKSYRGWRDFYSDLIRERDTLETRIPDSVSHETDADGGNLLPSSPQLHGGRRIMDSDKKGASFLKKVVAFHNPVEIYKRNGELFEALCINSVEQREAAVASNRKGISFLNWDDSLPVKRLSDYIWSEPDWPWKECAGVESAPGPSGAPPGVGHGDSTESNLRSTGAEVGASTVVRPGRDLTGGGAFGIPGYAGIGASGLGWQMQGNPENLVDSPATLETISAKAFAIHPSRPLFLVGSSYTRTYLWEFGEDKAAATYRVHPTYVAPPSALADVTTLSVDCCGHRFANGSSDGIVRTWQLEVVGRNNVGPTESSLCFNGSASDVCYVSTSGSVIAAAGYSSNGVNVVIWDTLAPSATSRASVMCHEGGACSIAVFDKDVGSGSITPLIVTGGKGGDVGLHDFRYIATGKSRRNKPLNVDERISDASPVDIQPGVSRSIGDHNRNGMLWYIPKAHSGTVTKISAIPNTTLFLTGSKDGDVKLWDAKTASLVYHWPKLHEKHTFLQWGFGGIARIAVTDIQVVSNGFLSCGGDGTVKLVRLQNLASGA